LNSTECTQPAMLTAGVATYRLWRERGGAMPAMMAGHSLGEFSALVAAGYFEFKAAVDLVRYRGELMQAAVPDGQGGIAAILGLGFALEWPMHMSPVALTIAVATSALTGVIFGFFPAVRASKLDPILALHHE